MDHTPNHSSIFFNNISKAFDEKPVLRKVRLEIPAKKSMVIIGRSGAGKSVLLKCLLGLMTPDSGNIQMENHDSMNETSTEREKRFEHIGVVFQSSALFDSLNVWQNISFRLLNKMSSTEAKAIAFQNLEAVGLAKRVADLYPCELSGGMQRRVAIARAIATSPRYLFFDEPTAGLDPIFSARISELIRKCISTLEVTAITITHDIHSAQIIGDNIAMLYEGKIWWEGRADQLFSSKNPVVDQFISGALEGPISVNDQ